MQPKLSCQGIRSQATRSPCQLGKQTKLGTNIHQMSGMQAFDVAKHLVHLYDAGTLGRTDCFFCPCSLTTSQSECLMLIRIGRKETHCILLLINASCLTKPPRFASASIRGDAHPRCYEAVLPVRSFDRLKECLSSSCARFQ